MLLQHTDCVTNVSPSRLNVRSLHMLVVFSLSKYQCFFYSLPCLLKVPFCPALFQIVKKCYFFNLSSTKTYLCHRNIDTSCTRLRADNRVSTLNMETLYFGISGIPTFGFSLL